MELKVLGVLNTEANISVSDIQTILKKQGHDLAYSKVLPAGATVCGWDFHPVIQCAFSGRTHNVMVECLGGELYPDVGDGLQTLANDYRLFIVSNCQSGYIETFLKFSQFGSLFEDFECWGNTGKSKSENLANVIARNSLKSPVMVGDMESDLVAAKKCGIPFFHIRYGFGPVSSSDQVFDSFSEFTSFVRGTL